MELAIATDYFGESPDLREVEERLAHIAQAGFSHVHWAHEWDGDYVYSIHEMEWIRDRLKYYGLKTKGVHASKGSIRPGGFCRNFYRNDHMRKDYSSVNEYSRKAGVDLVKNRVDLAEILETTEIVLHMILPCCDFETEGYEELYYRQIFRSLDELEEYCRKKGVRICIENMWAPSNDRQISKYDRLFRRYSGEFLGICIDTGHALLADQEENMLELAERYADRIYCIHAQDNPGPRLDLRENAKTLGEYCRACGEGDCHWIPMEGRFDWEGFARILAGSSYSFPLILETACHEGDEMEFLGRNLQAGRKLTEMVERFQQDTSVLA